MATIGDGADQGVLSAFGQLTRSGRLGYTGVYYCILLVTAGR